MFKAFEKIDLGNRAEINSTGAGLGLVISNNLVQRLRPKELTGQEDDSIKFESTENVGSTFYFEVFNHEETSEYESSNPPITDSTGSIYSEARIKLRNLQELIRELPMKSNQAKEEFPPSNIENIPTSHTERIQINPDSPLIIPGLIAASQSKTSCTCSKVLIVDDDVFNLTALDQILLSRYGLSCDWAFNGKEAIEKIQSRQHSRCCAKCQQYRIIFLDIQMPVLNGYETVRLLRQMTTNLEIDDLKIVACTAFVQESDEKEAMAG